MLVSDGSQERCEFFRGAIFNRKELSDRYLVDQPAPNSDSELVRNLYNVLKEEMPKVLVGDYAFAIFDTVKQSWFSARDPLGVVPLFYGSRSDGVYIFSDRIAKVVDEVSPEKFNLNYIAKILIEDYSDQSSTCYEGVSRVQGGHFLKIQNRTETQIRYWIPAGEPLRFDDKREYYEFFKETFFNVLKSRYAQKDCLLFLSGGMDSSAISYSMDKLGLDFENISFQLRNEKLFDKESLALVQDQVSKRSKTIKLDTDDKRMRDSVGDPNLFYSPGLYFYRVMLEESKNSGHTAAIAGLGGDDVYSLHVSYVADLFKNWKFSDGFRELKLGVDKGESLLRASIQFGLVPNVPNAIHKILKKLKKNTKPQSVSDEFLRRNQILEQRLESQLQIRGFYDSQKNRNILWRLSQWGGYAFGLEHQYALADRFQVSMSYPLMDQRLIELAFRLPIECLSYKGEDKIVLRESMQGIVPDRIRKHQNTQNYSSFSRQVFLRQSRKFADVLAQSMLLDAGVLDSEVVEKYRQNLLQMRCDNMDEVLRILHFEKILAHGTTRKRGVRYEGKEKQKEFTECKKEIRGAEAS